MKFKTFAAAAAIALGATAAQATSISIESFNAADYNGQLTGFTSLVSQDFEGYSEGNVGNVVGDAGTAFATNVGSFSAIGGTGSGTTVTNSFPGNNGSLLAIRDDEVFGRESTTALLGGTETGEGFFLDSNDTYGISWTATANGDAFNSILLTLTDGADIAGTTLTVIADGVSESFTAGGNGQIRTIGIVFGSLVNNVEVLFENTHGGNQQINDGFSLDDIVVGTVPLPASALFLLAGIGGLGAMKRRRKAA